MLFGKKANKVAAVLSAATLALTLTLPGNDLSLLKTADAANAVVTADAASGKVTYDFRDGSIIPTKTDGKSDVTKGELTVKVGKKNAYKWNDAQHGVAFKAGNSIEIKVDGPTKVTVGGCMHSNSKKPTDLTIKSADGPYTETKDVQAVGCYDKGGEAVYRYRGTAATTLIIEFTTTTYVPAIITEPLPPDVPDKNGTKKDTIKMYNFLDGSVVPASNTADKPVSGSVSSKDGFLTLTNKSGKLSYKGTSDGVLVNDKDTIEVKVAGDAIVSFNLCGKCEDANATLIASSDKGEFIGGTSKTLASTKAEGLESASFQYKGVATTLKFTVKAAGNCYIHGVNVSNLPEETNPPKAAGNGKIDVWDFGAEQLDTSKYNNMLTVDTINGFYPSDVKAGSTGVSIGCFVTDDLVFNGGGNTKNRIRGGNTAITRYDDKKAKTIDGVKLNGYVYSNNASAIVYMGIKLYKGDILTMYTGSNSGASTICCESPSGEVVQTGESNAAGVKLTFNAAETGMYKFYSKNEKLVVYRALREHTTPTQVSGTIDTSAAAGIKDYKLSFTNKTTGKVTEASVSGGKYSVYLNDSYKYDVSLVNANGYVITSKNVFDIAKGAGAVTENITIKTVDLVTVTGKITGLSADALKKLKLAFVNKSAIYVPEVTIKDDSITVKLEKGVKYDITADGVNDYDITTKTISKTANGTQDIAFKAKPTYEIKVSYNGLPDSAKSTAILTFTNLNEAGYVYTFKAGETPKLRDGVYSVKVTGTGTEPYAQKLTSNVKVDGKTVNKTISFEKLETWDFGKLGANNDKDTIGEANYFLGLQLFGNAKENQNKFLLVGKDAEVKIPVKKGQPITLEYCYEVAFEAGGKQVLSFSKSTGKLESSTYTATEDGFFTIKGIEGTTADGKTPKQTYFTKISVAAPVAYKAQVTVGKDKEYQTINDALAAVAKMDRGINNKRVTIAIDPGNYEEMLVINQPNITLVNAAGKNASLALTNKGVDIGKNVVRITSYYGTGYSYYSMGTDCKYNEEILAVNKENGKLGLKNPGDGSTGGSYWNATVVVTGSGFEADGIVFENSFNQYISKKEANDIVVMWESGSKGKRPTTYGDTTVQRKSFVERAAAMAIIGDKAAFNNCKFVGRQDTLYGGSGIKVAFNKCDILGATDFIFGGMTGVFYKCNLVMNTNDKDTADVAHLTAAQQKEGRGYLMYECNVTSTTPGVDTASETRSKPGSFGRPWQANTSEVVFYKTTVETTDYPGAKGKSLILADGWNNGLGATSKMMYEFGTVEKSGEDNSKSRVNWATVLDKPYIDDGKTEITIAAFLGDWEKTLSARGFFSDGDVDMGSANPATGTPAVAAGVLAAAIAGAAIAISKKKRK